jgi:hypothetical protein
MNRRSRIGRAPAPAWWRLALLAVLSATAFGWAGNARSGGIVLFTAEEAVQLQLTDDEWKPPRRTRSVMSGPRIVIQNPTLMQGGDGLLIETATPTDLAVEFQENLAPVDMSTLEVTARKGFFSKSLTSLLKPYIRGTALDVKGVEIPAGRFLVEIAIKDREGSETVEAYRLRVNAP